MHAHFDRQPIKISKIMQMRNSSSGKISWIYLQT